jgi:mitochondrial fission protein ELM1
LTGEKWGDRAQILALADALGWRFEEKRLHFNQFYKRSNIRLGASLQSLDAIKSDMLRPPWPDLVLASGRRAVPIARWIRRQSNGLTKLVHIGRPWAPLWYFDLVISTAQYQLPPRGNVLANDLTLNHHPAEVLHRAAACWAPVFAGFRRPLIGVLVGGSTKPFLFDAGTAAALGRATRSLATSFGGTVLVTTSPRTSEAAIDALFAEMPKGAYLHRFGSGQDNPYLGILALADRFIVTSDSASMLSEACRKGSIRR